MKKVTNKEKEKLIHKLLKYQKKGLRSYDKYLQDQLVYAGKSEIRKKYKKYIEDQIAMNNKKIKKIDLKLELL